MAEQEKRSKPSVADKISDLIEAMRETKSDVKESEVPQSTGEQLRKRKGIEHFLKRSSS